MVVSALTHFTSSLFASIVPEGTSMDITYFPDKFIRSIAEASSSLIFPVMPVPSIPSTMMSELFIRSDSFTSPESVISFILLVWQCLSSAKFLFASSVRIEAAFPNSMTLTWNCGN